MPAIDLGHLAVHYRDEGAGDPPILLIHELGGSSESFAALASLLAPHRRIIAPDLRGAGRTEKPPIPFTLGECADDIAALLAALNITRCDVLGTALGTIVALKLALRHPSLIRRAVLCTTAPGINERTKQYVSDRATSIRQGGMRLAVDASLNNAFPEAHAAIRAAYRPQWLANDPAAYADLSLALARANITSADWARLALPVLVANGKDDFIWPPEAGQAVAAAIPGARYETLIRAGHFPHLQAPDDLAGLALAFFA